MQQPSKYNKKRNRLADRGQTSHYWGEKEVGRGKIGEGD